MSRLQGLPPSLSLEDVIAAVEEDENVGFCLRCGWETSGVEPDAREYQCDSCGRDEVFGAAEILLMVSP